MLLLIASYSKPVEQVTPHIPAHAAWVKKYVDQGIFLFAGPKKSKLGGVLLAKSIDKKTLESLLQEDSYVKEDVCDYQIIDFDCKIATRAFELLLNKGN